MILTVILTSLSAISTHVHVVTIVTLVWCLFAFAFARNRMKTVKEISINGITLKERLSIFFKSDLSISIMLFIIFLGLVFWYYIF